MRTAVATLAAGVLCAPVLLTGTSSAAPGPSRSGQSDATRVYTLTEPGHGNPEGVTFDQRTQSFYVSATGDGTIYRGRLNDPTVRPFIRERGSSSVGIHEFRGRLYVAGGATGTIRVYDIRTRQEVASFETGAGGFLNDLVITGNGDVYVTDSVRPVLWHVTASQVRADRGKPEAIPVGDQIPFDTTPGVFNLNGIVALSDNVLVVVQSNTGNFYRIVLDNHRRRGSEPRITQVTGLNVPGGDGLLLDRGQLVVVQGNPARLVFAKLRDDGRRGQVVRTESDPTFRGPSTVARANNRYLVVNAAFGQPAPYTVSGVPR
jgi:sugar lactone lactonase YvrE